MLLANDDTFQKKIGPTPVGGEILVKVQISVAIMQIERTRSNNSDFDQSKKVQICDIDKTLKDSKPISFVLCFRCVLLIPLRHQQVTTTSNKTSFLFFDRKDTVTSNSHPSG